MTVKDALIIALSVINVEEADSADYLPVTLPTVNLLLSELYEIDRAIRLAGGLEPLPAAQRVTALSDELLYDLALMTDTLPFGLATYLVHEDDTGMSNFCNMKYEEGRRRRASAVVTRIQDVYGVTDYA